MSTKKLMLSATICLMVGACNSMESSSEQNSLGKADEMEQPTSVVIPAPPKCPVEFDQIKIAEAINGAKSCYMASKIAEACAFGSSADIAFVEAASKKCTKNFSKMNAQQQANYQYLLEKCADAYNQPGTLYLSLAAFCQLDVTQLTETYFPAQSEGEYEEEPIYVALPQCPIEENDLDKVVQAIEQTKQCYDGSVIAEACAWGSSADVQIAGAAAQKCKPKFDLTTAEGKNDNQLYQRLLNLCAEKLAGEGTLHLSFISYCQLSVAKLFNRFSQPTL